jgi:2-haloacid dehalogenase
MLRLKVVANENGSAMLSADALPALSCSNLETLWVTEYMHTVNVLHEVKPVKPDFAVLVGFEVQILPALLARADGAISDLSNVAPELFINLGWERQKGPPTDGSGPPPARPLAHGHRRVQRPGRRRGAACHEEARRAHLPHRLWPRPARPTRSRRRYRRNATRGRTPTSSKTDVMNTLNVSALAFDVFGTVVDWRSSVIREGEELGRKKGLDIDWATFADEWRGRYAPSMDRVRRGEIPWTNLDALHRASLGELIEEFGITGLLTEEENDHLNKAWHRLDPWSDSVPGLTRLRERYILTTLSNGNVALLTHMAKRAGLPWDLILSAELVRHYKPDPETYLMVPNLLDLRPEEVMLVAAHPSDLRNAQSYGLRAAYIPRPMEHGPRGEAEPADSSFDIVADDLVELAEKLGA